MKVTRRTGFLLLCTLPFSGAATRMARRKEGDAASAVNDATVSPALDGVALSSGSRVGQPADSLTYKGAARGAQTRTVSSKLDDTALSVMDFMTPAQATDVRRRLGVVDCTDAINAAFAHAQAVGRTVYLPDGLYLVGNLIFGSQSRSVQSATPLGLQGQSKTGTILKAKPGLMGTLLQSWSPAGVTFRDFAIDTTGSRARAWDCRWHVAGPSTQNVIEHILVTVHSNFADDTPHVDWDNLNDTYPTGVTVRGSESTHRDCLISMVQSGGLSQMSGCVWAGGYLRWGCQNGAIDQCWGHGIEFAAKCLNHVEIGACQIYSNAAKRSVLWSQSNATSQSIRALVCTATQFITENSMVPAYFDLAAYSILKFMGCQWNGPTSALLGKKSRNDSYANVLVKIEGGTHSGYLVLNDRPGFEIECEAFMNDATGRMVTKNRSGTFRPVIQGDGAARGTYQIGSGTYGRYHRRGNIVRFKLRIQWSTHSAASLAVHPQVTGLPLDYDIDGVDAVTLEYAGPTFGRVNMRATLSGGVISFYTADGDPVSLPATGDIVLSGTYSVKA